MPSGSTPLTLRLLPALAARIAIALAVREGDPAAATVLRALERLGAHRVALGLLCPEDALALARRLRPDAPVALAESAAARSHGDPLLLRAHLGLEDPGRLRLLLGARVRRLTQRGQDAATRLAVLGRPAGEELLGTGAQELVHSGVAVRADGEVMFAHAAVAGAALAGLDSTVRAGVHRLLAACMDDEAQAAHHHAAGGEPEAAQRKALAAAQRSGSLTDRARLLAIAARSAPPGAGATSPWWRAARSWRRAKLPRPRSCWRRWSPLRAAIRRRPRCSWRAPAVSWAEPTVRAPPSRR
jgi:hypothetical protein